MASPRAPRRNVPGASSGRALGVSEETRSAWQIAWLEDFWRDLCYAARGAAGALGSPLLRYCRSRWE